MVGFRILANLLYVKINCPVICSVLETQEERVKRKYKPVPNLLIVGPLYFQGNMFLLPPCLPHWPIVNGCLLMNNGRAEKPIKQGSPQKERKRICFTIEDLENINTGIQSSTPHRETVPPLPSSSHHKSEHESQ